MAGITQIYAKQVYPLKTNVTLKYWMPLHNNVSSVCKNFGELPFAKELHRKTGVKIEYIHPPKGLESEAFSLLLTSGALPDLFEYTWVTYPGGPEAAISNKYILKLNKYIKRYAVNFDKFLKTHPDIAKRVRTDAGSYYAFPFIRLGNTRITSGPIIRRDWLNELHLPIPTTADEWYTVLKAFKEKKGADAPFTTQLLNLRTTFGGAFNTYQLGFYVDQGKVKYGLIEPGTKQFLATMHKWYVEGLIDKNFSLNDTKAMDANILSGEAGAFFGSGGSGIGKLTADAKAQNPRTRIELIGIPWPSTQKGGIPKFGNISEFYPGNSCAISTKCKDIEAAVRFLDYSYSPEGHLLYNFGIAGTSYRMVNGYPRYTELITRNTKPMTQIMSMYMRSSTNGPFVQDQRYLEQYYSLPQQRNAVKQWALTRQANYNMPPITPAKRESEEWGKIMQNVTTYADDMTNRFIMGIEPIDHFDQFVAQIKRLNIARATAIQQAAYNRFQKR